MTAASPLVPALAQNKKVPVGLELYSVRNELTKDLKGTVTAVAKMGYQVVEFYSPYFGWSVDQTKEIRKLMDDLGIRCMSTHNGMNAFTGDGVQKAIELNKILGAKYVVLASAGGNVKTVDDWKGVADKLTKATEQLHPAGLRAGFHNHQSEWKPIDGQKPLVILADNTPKDFMMQLDVGTTMEVGEDPVAWIDAHPGRINSLHLKDWAPGEGKGYQVLFGEGVSPWKKIFNAAESKGGVEFYLIEQEGSRFPPLETAQKCLDAYKKLHG